MAKAYVECQSCGDTCHVRTSKNRREADRYGQWLELQGYSCEDCRTKEIQLANEMAAIANKTLGLPELKGSEKQISWSESLRADCIEKLQTLVDDCDDADYGLLSDAKDRICVEDSATFWIDNRYQSANDLLTKYQEIINKEQQQAAIDNNPLAIQSRAEATIQPTESARSLIAEINLNNNTLSINYPEKDDDVINIAKSLGLKWSGKCWQKTLSVTDENPVHRVAELGSQLLNKGVPVVIWDEDTRNRAIKSDYVPLHTRWITTNNRSTDFQIQWSYEEDYYHEAKNIVQSRYRKPYVVVPSEHYDEVIDFAERYEFKLSDGTKQLIEQHEEAKLKRLMATPKPVNAIDYQTPKDDFEPLGSGNDGVDHDLLD